MTHDEFLEDAEVAWATDGLSNTLANPPLYHRYYHFETARRWSCESVLDAATAYHFPIKDRQVQALWNSLHPGTPSDGSLFQTTAILNELQRQLRLAVDTLDESAAMLACDLILRWGGVSRQNAELLIRLHNHFDGGLVGYLTGAKALLTADDDYSSGKAFIAPNQPLYCTAGFTKIYSMLVDDFIIYDSRVAAALGMFVARLCLAERLDTVPKKLKFLWMPAQATRNVTRQLRNPRIDTLTFSTQRDHPRYLTHNIRASWLLRHAAERTQIRDWPGQMIADDARCSAKASCCATPRPPQLNPIRALEAGLFMIGYDLGGNPGYPPNAFAPLE